MKKCFCMILAAAVVLAAVAGAFPAQAFAASKPARVTGVRLSAYSASVMRVGWSKAGSAYGYKVYLSASKSKGYKCKKTTGLSYAYIGGLTVGHTYWVKVRAYRRSGKKKIYGAYSAPCAIRQLPGTKGITSVTAVSNTSCVVRFPALERRMGIEIFYFTRKDPAHNYDGVKAAHIERAGVTGLTVGGLAKGRSYWFMLRAYYRNGAGTKYYSGYTRLSPEYISWKTPSMAGLAAAAGGAGKVRLAWTASSGMSGYEAFVKDGTRLRSAGTLPGSASYADVGGLVSGRTYVFTARAWQTVNGRKIYSACAPYVSAKAG